jgi:hypothetical protein
VLINLLNPNYANIGGFVGASPQTPMLPVNAKSDFKKYGNY